MDYLSETEKADARAELRKHAALSLAARAPLSRGVSPRISELRAKTETDQEDSDLTP